MFGHLGPTVSPTKVTDHKLDDIISGIDNVLQNTVIHLGTCSIGLECFLTFGCREGDLYIFKTEGSGYCP